MKKILLITAFTLCGTLLIAQDSLVSKLVSSYSKPIAIQNNSLIGEGAIWLQQQVDQAQFVLVGEDHGIAEVPQFVDALYNDLYPKGFNNFVIEVGPKSLPTLLEMSSQKDLKLFEDFSAKYPFSIPFYSWKEEAIMLQHIYAKNNYKDASIWGLDQEFIVSLRQFMNELSENAPNATARRMANEYYEKACDLIEKAIETKNFRTNLMYSLTEDDLSKLIEAFQSKPEAVALINSIKESQDIYKKMSTDSYQSNLDRIALMKRNFYECYNKAKEKENMPKAIFKFGATHTYRGASLLNIFDIGNMASELAMSNGSKSFHILVVGAKGKSNRHFLTNSPDLKEADYDGKVELKSLGLVPVFESLSGNEWQLVDLKPMKKALWSGKVKVGKELEKTIIAYDAILLIPNITAASNF